MKKIYPIGVILFLIISVHTAQANTMPSGCRVGDNFSSTTGQPCTVHDCGLGDVFSAQTGKPCTSLAYLPGCFSTNGYSITTGTKCDSSVKPITTNQSQNMEPITQSPSSESATMPPITLPAIISSHANNRNQMLSVKTTVPTTLTVEYFDYSSILNNGIPSWNVMAPIILKAVADPSQVSTYTDTNSTTDHEIAYSNFVLSPNDFYCYKITAIDANGNSAMQTFNQSWGGDNIGTFNWSFGDEISTNKNG